jgi:hypothetical protein
MYGSSVDRLEEGIQQLPAQMQPLLLPIALRLVFWVLFAVRPPLQAANSMPRHSPSRPLCALHVCVWHVCVQVLSVVPDLTGLIMRLIDFQLSTADLARGEQLPWAVLFGFSIVYRTPRAARSLCLGDASPVWRLFVLSQVFILCDLYLFLWFGLVWNSIPPQLQVMVKNAIRGALGRPPLPEQPLLPAAGGAAART